MADAVGHGLSEIAAVARGDLPSHAHLRSRLIFLTVASLAVDVVGTILAFLLERHAHGTGIPTLGDAAFWTTTQLLTVSSALPNPLTTGGKVLDVALELWAITVVTALAGSFGAFFHRRSAEREAASAASG